MTVQNAEAKVLDAIFKALRALNQERAANAQVPVAETTCLFGEGSQLDSLALVSVIVDVETNVSDTFGKRIELADDTAMRRTPVPFTNVATLKAYLLERLAG